MDTNNVMLLFIAALNALTAFFAWRTHQSSVVTQANVAKVELATNSMKDALVKATADASHAAGITAGLAQAAGDRALFEAGAKAEREDKK